MGNIHQTIVYWCFTQSRNVLSEDYLLKQRDAETYLKFPVGIQLCVEQVPLVDETCGKTLWMASRKGNKKYQYFHMHNI